MDRVSKFFADLPAPVRHFIAILVGVFIAAVVAAIVANQSVFDLDWVTTLKDSIDKAIIAALASLGVLTVTPLTDAYGVGAAAAKDAKSEEIVQAIELSVIPDETPLVPYVEPEGNVEPAVGSNDAVITNG